MQIISFFSFKGGVGRTALLTNLGVLLAQRGDSVLLVDMDLAAPGLSYSPLASDWIDATQQKQGMSDLMAVYYQHFRDNPAARNIAMLPPSGLLRRMKPPKKSPAWDGRLYLLDAGQARMQVPETLSVQDEVAESGMRPIPSPSGKAADTPSAALRALATAMREDLAAWRDPKDGRGLDWVFIDCRTGFAELIDLGLGYLADRMVLVSGLNEQNLRGLRLTLEALQQHRVPLDHFPALVSIVLSPIPAGEDAATLEALDKAHKLVRRVLRRTESGVSEAPPDICYVHYNPALAVSDIPALLRQAPSLYRREVELVAGTLRRHMSPDMDPGEVLSDAGRDSRRQILSSLPRAAITPKSQKPPPPAPPVSLPILKQENPFARLPAWYWPLPESAQSPEQRQLFLDQHRFTHSDASFDRETLMSQLCWSISVSSGEKKRIIESVSQLSHFQFSSLSQIFMEEKSKFIALETTHWIDLLFIIYRKQREWLENIAPDREEALRRFLSAPFAGDDLFPSWRNYPLYWWLLGAEWLVHFNDHRRAEQAFTRAHALGARAEALKPLVTAILAENDDGDANPTQSFYRPLALALVPYLPELVFAYAQHQHQQGNAATVTELLTPLLNSPPDDADLCYAIGAFVLDHRTDLGPQSETVLCQAITLNPAHPWFWNGLGNLLTQHLHRYDEAEAAYRRAIDLDPKFAHPWKGLGHLLKNHLHRYDEAEAAYRRAIDLDPKDAYPWNGLGNLLTQHLHRYDEAEAAYRRAIDLDPKDAYPWNNLGDLLQDHLHRYDEAEAAFRRAIDLDPNYASPWNGLGNLLQDHLHRYDEAEAAYRRAIDLDPNYASPWNGLGNLLQDHLHRYDEAEAAYRRAIDLDPKNAYPWNNLGILLCQCGQGTAALDAYSRSAALEQPPCYGLMNRGRLRWCLGQEAEARADLAAAASGFATDTHPYGIVNSLFIALLRGDAALELRQRVQAALEYAPKNIWLHLALLLDALAADSAEVPAWYEACRTHLPSYQKRDTAIEYLYDLAGWRPECAARARAVARDFANLPPEVLARFGDVPVPERLACFQPFLDGESAGAGDPRDRVFYTKDGEPSAVTNDTDSGFS